MSEYPAHLIPFDLLELAEQFFKAYRELPAGMPPSWPRYFLLCHSIELVLKAYLTSRGVSATRLKNLPIRHSLEKLTKEAVNLGLVLSTTAQKEIKLLTEAHENFWPRYPKQDGKPVFIIDQFEPSVVELLRSVAMSLRGSNYRLFVDY